MEVLTLKNLYLKKLFHKGITVQRSRELEIIEASQRKQSNQLNKESNIN